MTLAASVSDGPIVIGMWTSPSTGGGRAYQDEVVKTLRVWGDELKAGEAVLMGDLNIGHAIGREVKNAWIAEAEATWTGMGLVSAYHAFTDEAVGAETQATHFHETKRERPWHIDFLLVPGSRMAQVEEVRVGEYGHWVASGLSDHLPLTIDIAWS